MSNASLFLRLRRFLADASRRCFGPCSRESCLAVEKTSFEVSYFKDLANQSREHTSRVLDLENELISARTAFAEKDDLCEQFRKRLGQQKSDHETILAASDNFAKGEIERLANDKARLEFECVQLRNELDNLKEDNKEDNYVSLFNRTSREVYERAINKGWWDDRKRLANAAERTGGHELQSFAVATIQSSLIALINSELSETLEAIRHRNPPDDKIPEFSGLEAELADTVIRIHDIAGAYDLRLGEAIEAKMAFNQTREHKHGGKVV